MRIESQAAVVTGASSGIGAALARELAAAGVRVGLIALPDEASGLRRRVSVLEEVPPALYRPTCPTESPSVLA